MRYLTAIGLLLAVLASTLPLRAAELSSPDGRIRVSVEIDERGIPWYSAAYRGEKVVQSSRLGMRFREQHGFDSGFRISKVEERSNDTRWELPWGERRLVSDRHNEMLVEFESAAPPQRKFAVRFRAFDDGIGFRYEVPEQRNYGRVDIVDELTEFRLAPDATAWWIPARRFNRYEYLYETTRLEAIETAHTPMTARLPSGVHVSIHEAALIDYAAFVLDQRREGVFQTNLTPWSDGIRVRTETPFKSPWRTIQVAPDAAGLIDSTLILNLNEPNALGDVSWVEPGKYVGIWWAMHLGTRTWGSGPKHGATTAETKRYIDFAAKHGFDGVLVEGWNVGWDGDWYTNGDVFSFTQAYPDFDLEGLAAYAAERSVRLIGHHETAGSISNYERQMADAFDLYQALGVRQVKTGYVADAGGLKRVDDDGVAHYEWHDGQFSANHHLRVLKEAARRQISINPHEPIKDTGLRRTYPNWIAREGARGQEYNAWGEPPNPPEHTAILPYTRMLSGPMDFTPGIFDLTFKGPDSANRVQTTLAKQLSLYVVLYSPIQMAADLPENYEKHPDAFRFIVDVPTDWERSVAVAGEVGDYVAIARRERGGDDWYLGALTDEEARRLSIPLSFLEAGRRYDARIYRDGDNAHWRTAPYDIAMETRTVSSSDVLDLPLAAGGGVAIRFEAR